MKEQKWSGWETLKPAETPEPEPASAEEEVYESVEDYDPVLRSHCRL